MFEEATLYSPVVTTTDGGVVVELTHDHPGFLDEEYRERRNTIAALAMAWQPGQPMPQAPYTEQEHAVWAVVQRELAAKHERLACRAALEGGAVLHLPQDRIPQLDEVSAALAPITGVSYLPAAGLVPSRQFYGALADGHFWSTQYIRHHSVPFYTPEPDVVHEVVGHATTLAHPEYVAVYTAAGRAARRLETDDAISVLAKVFWFSLEFGVVHEPDGPKAYGAGLLSSYGEIEEFAHADLRPLDLPTMATLDYDITHYQPVLFAAASWSQVLDVVGGFFDTLDDDTALALRRRSAVPA